MKIYISRLCFVSCESKRRGAYFFDKKSLWLFDPKEESMPFFANGCELEEEGCFFLRETENFRFFKNRAIKYPGKAEAALFLLWASRSYSERPEAFIMPFPGSGLPKINQSR